MPSVPPSTCSTSKQAGAIMAQIQIPLFNHHACVILFFSIQKLARRSQENETRFIRNQTPKASAARTARARIDSPRPSFQLPNHQRNPGTTTTHQPTQQKTRPTAAQAHSPSLILPFHHDPSSTMTFLFCFTIHVTEISLPTVQPCFQIPIPTAH